MAEGQSNRWLNDEKKIEENIIYQNTRVRFQSMTFLLNELRLNSTSSYLFKQSIEPLQH